MIDIAFLCPDLDNDASPHSPIYLVSSKYNGRMHSGNGDRAQLILGAAKTCTELQFHRTSHLRNSRMLPTTISAAQGTVGGKFAALMGGWLFAEWAILR
jgi:hypothetical protein